MHLSHSHPADLECQVAVIGAGVVGLSTAARLSREYSTVLIEAQGSFGQDTSSRNSEVVHSGIYYGAGSLKTELCVEGRKALYAFCDERDVAYNRCGKWLVATAAAEEDFLEKVYAHCKSIDVPCERVAAQSIARDQPELKVHSALYFPETGIVDAHGLMAALEREAAQNAVLAYQHRLKEMTRVNGAWRLSLESTDGKVDLKADRVINCAGLAGAEIANRAHGISRFEHRYCRGRYFTLSGQYRGRFKRLVYPVPPKDGLGIHITISLDGNARLGPDVNWTQESRYLETTALYQDEWSSTLQRQFADAARRYIPSVETEHLTPGFVGIRPKLFIDGRAHTDFLIHDESGLISLLGIESPGLTASLAIAERVEGMLGSRPQGQA